MITTAPSLGQTLAQQGLKAMYHHSVQYGKDQASIGETYLGSVASHSDNLIEKQVAATAQHAWDSCETWRGQVGAAKAALSAISAGVGGAMGVALGRVGADAMYNDTIATVRDQVHVGYAFVGAVRDHSTDNTEKALAETALRSANNANTVRAQCAVLGNFLTSM